MKAIFAACVVIAVMSAGAHAQSLNPTGTWQGVLHLGGEQHQILKISRREAGGWTGSLYWPDNAQAADTTIPRPITGISLHGHEIQFSIEGAHYKGAISPDGKSMSGELKQGDIALPFNLTRANPSTAWPIDPSKHTVRFVSVGKGVSLEVVDWGGRGSPLIFLPGLGFTAHEFDSLAPEFVATNHVYAITRRGFGQSSKPAPTDENYSADRLGDDVIAVMNALKLNRAIVAGHSIAGEELSSLGSRYPERVMGLVYLDAGYSYAYYSPGNVIPLGTNLQIKARELIAQLDSLRVLPRRDQDLEPLIRTLQSSLPEFEKDLTAAEAAIKAEQPDSITSTSESDQDRIEEAITNGAQKYTHIDAPILALFEDPPLLPAETSPDVRTAQNAQFAAQADAFQAGLPNAQVVRLPNARHALWMTNKEDVVREMKAFIATLH